MPGICILNDGNSMPRLGIGTWAFEDRIAENSVFNAVKCGYRLIDTARNYRNEIPIGHGIKRAIQQGIVKRGDIFITTKISPDEKGDFNKLIDDSNAAIGLDYIDLVLVHHQGTRERKLYSSIEKAIDRGIVRSIGLSNFYTPDQFERITAMVDRPPAVVQNECHPLYQNNHFNQIVSHNSIIVEAYRPLGGRNGKHHLLHHEAISSIARVHGVSSAQVIIKWHLQMGRIAIPGSADIKHMTENISVPEFVLTCTELDEIAALDTNTRLSGQALSRTLNG